MAEDQLGWRIDTGFARIPDALAAQARGIFGCDAQGGKQEGGAVIGAIVGPSILRLCRVHHPAAQGMALGIKSADDGRYLVANPALGALLGVDDGGPGLFGLVVLGRAAGVADVRVGQRDQLPGVGGIGDDLLVAGHGGVEHHFAGAAAGGAYGDALEYSAVFEREDCGLVHGLSPWLGGTRSQGVRTPADWAGPCPYG